MSRLAPPLHYLALGDSYTIGEAVATHERWPALLVDRLRQDGVAINDPHMIAVTGWTTDELAAAMDEATFSPPYDLVTLQIGVNNQYRGRPAEEYRQQFAALMQRAVTLSGGRPARVLVVSIPDWGVTRFAREQGRDPARIASELDTFNTIARGETARCGAQFVNITGISRDYPQLVADDGLHPSSAQYQLWIQTIVPVALGAVR
jgi:lysophospholipase L1-like esterase